jgi:hypothetical protein
MFEVEVVFEETTPVFRHAILRTGTDSWLHPAELTGKRHGAGLPSMFDRGHLDHVALTASSPEAFELLRRRLQLRGATDGRVDDLGAFHTLWFSDPDGMQGGLTLIVDAGLGGDHAPRERAEQSEERPPVAGSGPATTGAPPGRARIEA